MDLLVSFVESKKEKSRYVSFNLDDCPEFSIKDGILSADFVEETHSCTCCPPREDDFREDIDLKELYEFAQKNGYKYLL